MLQRRLAQRQDAVFHREVATEVAEPTDAQAAQAARERFMQEVIGPAIRPQALALVRQHQQAGDEVVIITATNEFVTRPIADAFGVQQLIAVELARDAQGWITGEIRGVPSFREGKVQSFFCWLAARHLTRAQAEVTFYSDSINDLPLMEHVDHPVATNPDDRLRQLATQRGWRILNLF